MDNQLLQEVNALALAMSEKAHPLMRLDMAEYQDIAYDELAKEYEFKFRTLLASLGGMSDQVEDSALVNADDTIGYHRCKLSYWATAYSTAHMIADDIDGFYS